jgi:hypothetical protein
MIMNVSGFLNSGDIPPEGAAGAAGAAVSPGFAGAGADVSCPAGAPALGAHAERIMTKTRNNEKTTQILLRIFFSFLYLSFFWSVIVWKTYLIQKMASH